MANMQNSYEFGNPKPSIQEIFQILITKYPTLLSKIRRGANAVATKEEWMEDSLSPASTTIASFDTNGAGTGINVASTTGMQVGQILRFESSAGADRGELVQIATVDSATDLTVTRLYGGNPGAAVTLVVGDTVHSVSKPYNEGSSASASANSEPSKNYNYTQIFRETAKLSNTALAVNQFGNANSMAYQLNRKQIEVMMQINQQLIYGERVVRSGSAQGTFGGILSFVRGGNVDTTGSAISKTIINNLIEAVWADGSMGSDFLIVCAQNQARKISAFNTAGSNPLVMTSPDNKTTGGYIARFIGDLPVQQGFTADILVEPNFPKDKLLLLDLNSVELAYLREFTVTDATLSGDDAQSKTFIGELTLRVRNGQKAHGLATGLTI